MHLELLAPAGNPSKMKYAFTYGTDACFMGIPDFSLRSRLNNFNLNSIKACIDYAHGIDKKIYATFNIFAHNEHLKRFEELHDEFLEFFTGPSKPDAVIVADPGLMLAIHELAPEMPIHVSTQANTINYKAVQFWQQNGATRVVLGREASLEDIRVIHATCPDIEIEYFVHGAMCMAYSGRCFLSRYFTGASANLGACSHPCRGEYVVKGEQTNGDGEKEIILLEDEHGSYFFNSHDLCTIEHIEDLIDAGVTSFKIEGRTKSIFYVSMVVKAYREVIDAMNLEIAPLGRGEEGGVNLNPSRSAGGLHQDGEEYSNLVTYWKNELEKLVNRGYTTGFLFGESRVDPSYEKASNFPNDYRFVGEYRDDGLVMVHNKICIGDEVDIIPITGQNLTKKITKITLQDGKEVAEFSAGNSESIAKVEFEQPEAFPAMTLIVKNYGKS